LLQLLGQGQGRQHVLVPCDGQHVWCGVVVVVVLLLVVLLLLLWLQLQCLLAVLLLQVPQAVVWQQAELGQQQCPH
jgi:hypothetical protein